MDPNEFLKNGQVVISKETYAVIKAKHPDCSAFATIIDNKETTIIIDQTKVNEENIIEIEKDWKLLTFDMTLPFELVGFLAIIAQALAQAKVSIFALSSYSTDHILVRVKDLNKCKEALSRLGCKILSID
jgi:uncharacterized protein